MFGSATFEHKKVFLVQGALTDNRCLIFLGKNVILVFDVCWAVDDEHNIVDILIGC